MIRYLIAAALVCGLTYALTSDIGLVRVPTGPADPAKIESRFLTSASAIAPKAVRLKMVERTNMASGLVADGRQKAIRNYCHHNSSMKAEAHRKCVRDQGTSLASMQKIYTAMGAIAGQDTFLTAWVLLFEDVFNCERRDRRTGEIDWQRTQQCSSNAIHKMNDEIEKLSFK